MGYGGTLGLSGGWGVLGWGTGGPGLLFLSAEAVRENVVRLTFSSAVNWTMVEDPYDGSLIDRYLVEELEGTVGYDGLPAKPVSAVTVAIANDLGTEVDVTIDRTFSPYPARYRVTVNNLYSTAGDPLGDTLSIEFDGLFRGLVPNMIDQAVPRKDIANPNDLAALLDPVPTIADSQLGVFVVDSSGDYAADEGLTSYRKRVFRRIMTAQNGFAHLPGYGVGLLNYVKQLATIEARSRLETSIVSQINEEPETTDCTTELVQDPAEPGLWYLRLRARASTGETINELIPLVGV